jgi:hypothetical protein
MQRINQGPVAGLSGRVRSEGFGSVLKCCGPDFLVSGARALLAEGVHERVEEDGVEGSGCAVHACFDDLDDLGEV